MEGDPILSDRLSTNKYSQAYGFILEVVWNKIGCNSQVEPLQMTVSCVSMTDTTPPS